jgi:hypothetical protein
MQLHRKKHCCVEQAQRGDSSGVGQAFVGSKCRSASRCFSGIRRAFVQALKNKAPDIQSGALFFLPLFAAMGYI